MTKGFSRKYAPPWRERGPDGNLGKEYGPKTLATYAKHCQQWGDWAYQPPSKSQRPEAEMLRQFMRPDGELRDDIADSLTAVYLAVYEGGATVNGFARELGITRGAVRSYRDRLIDLARQEARR